VTPLEQLVILASVQFGAYSLGMLLGMWCNGDKFGDEARCRAQIVLLSIIIALVGLGVFR